MIDRDRDEQTLTCDKCRAGLDLCFPKSQDGFRKMIEEAKAHGWLIRPGRDGSWVHFCPDCGSRPINAGRETTLAQARRVLGVKKPRP